METSARVKVGGQFACFSRPDFKVERVSYPVITPSAARGVLEAIFWKPEFRWEIRRILVLKPIRQFAILRNEIDSKQGAEPIVVEDHRQQRTALILRDVEYVIEATFRLRHHCDEHPAKYLSQFERRTEKGQQHHTPYLGCKEFPAWFEAPNGDETPIDIDLDIGMMLFDIAFVCDPQRNELRFIRHTAQGSVECSGYAQPVFFHARIEHGVLDVPGSHYDMIYRLEACNDKGTAGTCRQTSTRRKTAPTRLS